EARLHRLLPTTLRLEAPGEVVPRRRAAATFDADLEVVVGDAAATSPRAPQRADDEHDDGDGGEQQDDREHRRATGSAGAGLDAARVAVAAEEPLDPAHDPVEDPLEE